MQTPKPGYTAGRESMLRVYDLVAGVLHKPLQEKYGAVFTHDLVLDTRAEFAMLIQQIPFIGDDNVWKGNLLMSAGYLGLYRALRRRDWGTEQAGKLLWEIHEMLGERIPRFLLALAGRFTLGEAALEKMRQGALLSQERRYPADWVFQQAEPKDPDAVYAYEISECAILKFYRAQGAAEFTPYLCALDIYQGHLMGYTFMRTGTLAEGAPCCDPSAKPGGKTLGWPPVTYPSGNRG
jgi:hypothetical protein